MILIYSESCWYCLTVARTINKMDVPNTVETVPIESDRGERMIEDHHNEYVHAPHLFTEDRVYYGVRPVATGLLKEYPGEAFGGE